MDSVGFMGLLVAIGFVGMIGLYVVAMRHVNKAETESETNLTLFRVAILIACFLPGAVVVMVLSQMLITSAEVTKPELVVGYLAGISCVIGVILAAKAGRRERGMVAALKFCEDVQRAIKAVPIEF